MTASRYDAESETLILRIVSDDEVTEPNPTPPSPMMVLIADEEAATHRTLIEYNGVLWGGGAPDLIAQIVAQLEEHDLDPEFLYTGQGQPYISSEEGKFVFFGRFSHVSRTYRVLTNDPAVIAQLTAAISSNPTVLAFYDEQQRPEDAE